MKLMRAFLSLCVVIACLAAAGATDFSSDDVLLEEWREFMSQHNKGFKGVAADFRLSIFRENRVKIARHNQKYYSGERSFKLGMNKYGDMLPTEFKRVMNAYNHTRREELRAQHPELRGATFVAPYHVSYAKTVDWRKSGAVTAVKDQGHCGSCWAFSSTGALEGQHFRTTGVLVSLSEQNLIDCSKDFGNNGCNGGLMDGAFRYVKQSHGIDTEKSYPYEGIDDHCQFNIKNVGATDTGFVDIRAGDEEQLMQAVASVGPVSVAIDASRESFQLYSEGIYDEPECDSEQLDHGVLVVGYGTDKEGRDYWLIKNSWGVTWGEKGYMKMARNKNNMCGIASGASYPLV